MAKGSRTDYMKSFRDIYDSHITVQIENFTLAGIIVTALAEEAEGRIAEKNYDEARMLLDMALDIEEAIEEHNEAVKTYEELHKEEE